MLLWELLLLRKSVKHHYSMLLIFLDHPYNTDCVQVVSGDQKAHRVPAKPAIWWGRTGLCRVLRPGGSSWPRWWRLPFPFAWRPYCGGHLGPGRLWGQHPQEVPFPVWGGSGFDRNPIKFLGLKVGGLGGIAGKRINPGLLRFRDRKHLVWRQEDHSGQNENLCWVWGSH